jgi:hypothetical protein
MGDVGDGSVSWRKGRVGDAPVSVRSDHGHLIHLTLLRKCNQKSVCRRDGGVVGVQYSTSAVVRKIPRGNVPGRDESELRGMRGSLEAQTLLTVCHPWDQLCASHTGDSEAVSLVSLRCPISSARLV